VLIENRILKIAVIVAGLAAIVACASSPPTPTPKTAAIVLSEARIADPEAERLARTLAVTSGVSEEVLASSLVSLRRAGLDDTQARLAMLEQAQVLQEKEKAEATEDFLGFKWGTGIGAVFNVGGDDRVDTAKVVNGMVRVEKEANHTARIFSEVHNFKPKKDDETVGQGPFVAVQSSSEKLIDSFSVGYMRGWRKSATSESSINVGFGLVLDTRVKELGNGIVEDEENVRLKEKARVGLGIFVSFSYGK
jgi:hypothetical protein